MTDDDKHARAQTFAHIEDLEREVTRLRLLEKVADWVQADAARFRWLQEHTVAAGLGRFVQQHNTQFLAQAVDAAAKAEREREDMISVERGRKVGELTPIREQTEEPAPIDMILYCPNCGMQHIDAPEFNGTREDKFPAFGEDPAMSWTNPPHRSHLCHGCGHIWRPADVATNGVAAIKTRGKNDSPMGACAHPVAHPAPVERVALSDEQVLACIRSAQVGPVPMGMTRERGPYDVTEPTYFAQRFARAVIAEYERLSGISADPPWC